MVENYCIAALNPMPRCLLCPYDTKCVSYTHNGWSMVSPTYSYCVLIRFRNDDVATLLLHAWPAFMLFLWLCYFAVLIGVALCSQMICHRSRSTSIRSLMHANPG